MTGIEELERRVVGWRFPGGCYTVAPYAAWLCHDVLRSPALPPGVAHPQYVYYAALGGMGVTLDELFALVDATSDSGVMFGEAGIEQRRPLGLGKTYDVRGEITGIVRKTGRRAGTFDVLSFVLEVVDGGEVVGVSTNHFVFPRKDA